MLIDLSELLSVKDKELEVTTQIEMSEFATKMVNYKIVDKKPFTIKLKNIGKRKVLLTAQVEVTLIIPCDRCLEDVRHVMNIKVNKEIDMNESECDRVKSSDDFYYMEENNLNVEKLLYNEILVNIPMKVLCSETCKGICNRCGANLNSQTCNCDTTELDPRMSKIRDIFNNFKEV